MILSKKIKEILYKMTDKIRNNGLIIKGEYKEYTIWRIADDRITLFYMAGLTDWKFITCFTEQEVLQNLYLLYNTIIGIRNPEYIIKLRRINDDF
jgi:hypothetical protein